MTSNLDNIFSILLQHFGEQDWWPAETPFEVIVGAVLTQNTSWKNVEKSIKTLKEHNLLSPDALYSKKTEEVADFIKASGFYNLKAKRLKNFLEFFKGYDFDLERLKKEPHIREKLLNIKGIGKETADSILLYALGQPFFVVDAYTKRIFFRLGVLKSEKTDYDDVQQIFHRHLPKDVYIYNEFHALIVETAKNYCRKTPLCKACPLLSICVYGRETQGNVENDYLEATGS